MILVAGLPYDSATVRAMHGPAVEWSTGDYLLAHIADLLAAANWQRAGRESAPKPTPIERPGNARKIRLTGAEIQRRLLAQREA